MMLRASDETLAALKNSYRDCLKNYLLGSNWLSFDELLRCVPFPGD